MSHRVLVKISIIINTYNWPHALQAVLTALAEQNTSDPFEIIIADDGSGDETTQLIRRFKSQVSIPVLHLWQPNEGFRTAIIRNKAVLAAEGDYLIFLEGNSIPRVDFIEKHIELAEPKNFVVGNAVPLSRKFTLSMLAKALSLHHWPLWRWCLTRLVGNCSKLLPFVTFPTKYFYLKTKSKWKSSAAYFGVWKTDLLNVNGWEEKITGSGLEDPDLIMRLLHSGMQRKVVYSGLPVVQLWSEERNGGKIKNSELFLKERSKLQLLCAEKGLNQYEI